MMIFKRFVYLCAIITKWEWMEIKLNDYHKKVDAEKIASMAYWKAHPLSRKESLNQLRRLREQRLASLSNW